MNNAVKTNKKSSLKAVMMTLIAAVFSGCGGGGGGGGSDANVPNYAGAWTGTVSLVSNTCARQIPDEFIVISFLHNVDQGTSRDALGNVLVDIVLDDGVDTYTGIGESDVNGQGSKFSATGAPHELPGFINSFKCIETLDYEYDAIDFTNQTAGFVSRHSSIVCTRGTDVRTCDVTYTGSAWRTAEPQ